MLQMYVLCNVFGYGPLLIFLEILRNLAAEGLGGLSASLMEPLPNLAITTRPNQASLHRAEREVRKRRMNHPNRHRLLKLVAPTRLSRSVRSAHTRPFGTLCASNPESRIERDRLGCAATLRHVRAVEALAQKRAHERRVPGDEPRLRKGRPPVGAHVRPRCKYPPRSS